VTQVVASDLMFMGAVLLQAKQKKCSQSKGLRFNGKSIDFCCTCKSTLCVDQSTFVD